MLKKYSKLVGVMVMVVAGLALCIGAVVNKQTAEQEKNLSIDQVPTVVRTTVQAQGGTVEEIEMETENGQTVYEAEVTIEGQKLEVKVGADGRLLSKEMEDEEDEDEGDNDGNENAQKVSIDQVPPAVKATILEQAQGGTIKDIESKTENEKTIYEADVLINEKELEIKVAPDGTLISNQAEDEDDDDHDGGEEDD